MKNEEQKRLFKLTPQLTIFQVPIKMSVGAFCMCAHYLCCTLRMLQKKVFGKTLLHTQKRSFQTPIEMGIT